MKKFAYWLEVAALGLILGLILQGAKAWTEPAADPPGGNLGAPINTSGNSQTKTGTLVVGSLGVTPGVSLFSGNVGIGTTVARSALDVVGNTLISGNVGIGTLNPAAKLQVMGEARVGDACLNTDSTKCLSKMGTQPVPHGLYGICSSSDPWAINDPGAFMGSASGSCVGGYTKSPAICSGFCGCESGYSLVEISRDHMYKAGSEYGGQFGGLGGINFVYSCYKD